ASNGGSAITGFTVTSNPGGITGQGAASPISVTGLTNGTAYTFTVTAANAVGTGPASSPSNQVTPSASATVPDAPTIGTATAGNAQATVSFTPPASNGGSAITGYTVTSNPGGITGQGAASPITVTGLTNGTAYTFTVTATNAIGTGSPSGSSNQVTPTSAPTFGTEIYSFGSGSTNSPPGTCSINSNVSVGQRVVVIATDDGNAYSVTGVTDTKGNSYSQMLYYRNTNYESSNICIWSAYITTALTAGKDTITVGWNSVSSWNAFAISIVTLNNTAQTGQPDSTAENN